VRTLRAHERDVSVGAAREQVETMNEPRTCVVCELSGHSSDACPQVASCGCHTVWDCYQCERSFCKKHHVFVEVAPLAYSMAALCWECATVTEGKP
jgi:hypothetical protein